MISFGMNIMWIEYAKTFVKNITNIYKKTINIIIYL